MCMARVLASGLGLAVGSSPELRLDELPPEFREPREPRDEAPRRMPVLPAASEGERLRWALDRTRGHVGQAATLLGMSRPTFWRKRKRYGL